MLKNVFWTIFEKSGNIEAYMAYKDELLENGRGGAQNITRDAQNAALMVESVNVNV